MKRDASPLTESPYDENFSYANPKESRARQLLVKAVERITGAHQLLAIYEQLKA